MKRSKGAADPTYRSQASLDPVSKKPRRDTPSSAHSKSGGKSSEIKRQKI